MVLKCQHKSYLESLLNKTQIARHHPGTDGAGLGWSPRLCTSNMLSGEADAAGQGATDHVRLPLTPFLCHNTTESTGIGEKLYSTRFSFSLHPMSKDQHDL